MPELQGTENANWPTHFFLLFHKSSSCNVWHKMSPMYMFFAKNELRLLCSTYLTIVPYSIFVIERQTKQFLLGIFFFTLHLSRKTQGEQFLSITNSVIATIELLRNIPASIEIIYFNRSCKYINQWNKFPTLLKLFVSIVVATKRANTKV